MKALFPVLLTIYSFSLLSLTRTDHTENFNFKEKFSFNSPLDLGSQINLNKSRVNSDQNSNSGQYSGMIENIRHQEYNISYDKETDSYQSPNRANNLRFIYHNDGFTAEIRNTKIPLFDINDKMIDDKDKKYELEDEWSIKLKVESEKFNVNDEELIIAGNKAFIEDENLRIEYTNDEAGMRQDFIIKRKPDGEDRLRLNLSADTKLRMIAGADALMFKDRNGEDKMKYSALKCWDANGKELRAYFEGINHHSRDNKDESEIRNYRLKNKSKIRIQKSNSETHSKFRITDKDNSGLFSIVVNDEDAVYPVTIDPLSSSPDWTTESNQADAGFGVVVATAGDVNGDGYSDVIVGAPLYDSGQPDEGKVFVYYGSAAGLPASPNWTAESNQASAEFGNNAATAGDVNGDGYSDVVVGAYRYDNGQNDEGRAFVYHGSASGLSATPNWTAESNQANARFGLGVSAAGDVNGDGYGDLVVGAYQYDNTFTDEGCIFVYAGTATGLVSTPNWIVFGGQTGAGFGGSVSTAGDVNGDGYSDVIAGAYGFDNGQTDEGKVFVYHGSPFGISLIANWSAESNQNFAYYGISVSTAGDINGDGYSDVVIGSYLYDNGQTDEGAAFVYNGSVSGLSSVPGWIGEGNQNNASYGLSVHTAGDVNGDGYADIIVGAYLYDNGQADEGSAFIYKGSAAGLSASPYWTGESNQSGAAYGWSVCTAGDVNGDGYSDVLSGARFYDNEQNDEGRVYEYNGSPEGLSTNSNWSAESNLASSNFGLSVSSAGDVNGDGYNDVIIGAPYFDNGEVAEGRAFVYYGTSSGLSVSAGWTAEPNIAGANFGTSVSTAGDVNDDGYCDVIIGAPSKPFGGAYVYYGSATGLSITPGWTKISDQAGSRFGISVSTAGDVNGDGFSEVLIGASLYDNGQVQEGKAFAYYGSASGPSSSPDWTAESNQIQAEFGENLSSAGDVNGDGYSDVLIGCYKYNESFTDEGKAFLYQGSSSGLSATPNWTATGNQANARYGQSISTAGDVNGDGFSDVIVGAYLYDLNFTDEGCVFVYPGSASGLSVTANWIGYGNQASAFYGGSVAAAGDVNGDGYNDIIIGAPDYDNGQTDEGAAFVYNGSATGLALSPGWTAESNQANSNFGVSVSSAGDVNGDGYSDVIAGAYNYDNGQTDEGKVFAYYGNSGSSLRSTMNQYKPFTANIVYSGGLTGTAGGVRFNLFGKSPFGRTQGKIVYEYKANGIPFSGSVITRSTSSSGSGINTSLTGSGIQLNKDISGLLSTKEYKWRARVQYKLTSNPYQKLGPWKYYENYIPLPNRSFRPSIHSGHALVVNLNMFIQGFYNSSTNTMRADTVKMYLHESIPPYILIDSAVSVLNENGQGTFTFYRKSPCKDPPRKIRTSHRNSIDTWSSGNLECSDSSEQHYDFTIASSQAYGSNMIQVNTKPVTFAIYSGDVNKDGTVDASDLSETDNDAFSSVSGYVRTDVTGDDFVDAADVSIVDNNAFNSVSVISP